MILGQLSLNLSFIMYTALYLPQVIHNQRQRSLAGLSKWMHIILYLGYSLDVVYGIGNHLPWQYCAVSGMGWLLLTVQHIQLIEHLKQSDRRHLKIIFYGILALFACLLILTVCGHNPFPKLPLYAIGYTSQLAFGLGYIPQILKSKRLQSARAMNLLYVLQNLLLAILDSISAWQLGWDWPNKVGSGLVIILTCILLIQAYQYSLEKEHLNADTVAD